MHRKVFYVFIGLLIVNFPLYADDRIIAIVNKDSITRSEADMYLNVIAVQLSQQFKGSQLEEKLKEERRQLVTKMVEDKIILQEAKKKGYHARPERVKYRIEQLKANYDSETDFEDSLKQRGLTVRDLENKINDQMIMREVIEREVREKVVVSPDEVTKFYEKNKEELFMQPQARIAESLYLEDENILEKLAADLRGGMEFQAASKEYKCAYSKDTVSLEELRPEVQEEFSGLKPGEISPAVKAGKGFYIFKLLEILQPRLQGLSEAHDRIFSYLFEEKFTLAMLDWLEGLKSKAYIEIKDKT